MLLLGREMLDPRLPRNLFVEKVILPTFIVFNQALIKLCPALDETKSQFIIRSIVGQLLHTIQVQRMFASEDKTNIFVTDIDTIVDHIVKFSAAGIRAYEKEDM